MDSTTQETLEDAGIGAANVLAWFANHFEGILVGVLTMIYFWYKIKKERNNAEKARIEKQFMQSQFEEWEETKTTIEDLKDKLNK
ncbi:MAG: hypothetical protein HRU18_12020 [Pseudoalteromonas sp.]|uniref:hypothetical protein n=1 Tax=Pseudoalteromonas sp. TaxID=53249 RepID=UPI001D90431B|nr:hypothetical protein [Pseudoalteromonas sp.]NRA78928.1 hypothetical protein [Pseudoalteromonas sp.]